MSARIPQRLKTALGMLFALAATGGGAWATPAEPLRPAAAPGDPVPGLQYFRLDPALADTTFRLLVVPVRFPEDAGLGPADLNLGLNGDTGPSVRRLYLDGTGGRLLVEATLAPEVTAAHERAWYTVSEGGQTHFGLSTAAYPRNAPGLVEEVTAQLEDRIDLRLFDNTLDGIVDGLLLLHSGPATGEVGEGPPPAAALLAHSFTVSQPVFRGGVQVFPYAVASARDGVGVWAHELGHLLGLPDLYVANPFPLCPPEGIGEWSLMATGANRDGGDDPVGLDAFSRQLLGVPAEALFPAPIDLTGAQYVRVFSPGEADGPRYFLVERRAAGEGPAALTPAFVVYWVDEDAVDNRDCSRPLIEVRAVVPPSGGVLHDDTTPGLRDPQGRPTGLQLQFSSAGVAVTYRVPLPVRVAAVRLLPVAGSDPERRPLEIVLENLDPAAAWEAEVNLAPLNPGAVCASSAAAVSHLIPPGHTVIDTTWSLLPCGGTGALPVDCASWRVELTSPMSAATATDTTLLCTGPDGLSSTALDSFTAENLNPPRADPWTFTGTWVASAWAPFAHARVHSPWFVVPVAGVAVVQHTWSLDLLSADFASDAGTVSLEFFDGPATRLSPALGWGYHAARGTGNPLGGDEVLSGGGDRVHVLDVSPHAGRVARLSFTAGGDVTGGGSFWELKDVSVAPRSPAEFAVVQDEDGTRIEPQTSFSAPVNLQLYRGDPALTPTALGESFLWTGEPSLTLSRSAQRERLDLLWRDAENKWGVAEALTAPTGAPSAPISGLPAPNPWREGAVLEWVVTHPPGSAFGRYRFEAFDAAGRRVWSRSVSVATVGTRTITWNGTGDDGRIVPAGVYFLRIERPDGSVQSLRIVRIS